MEDHDSGSKPDLRSLAGTAILIAGLALYALICAEIAIRWLPDSGLIEFAFYLAAGLAWIYPAMRLIRWMVAGRSGG